MSGFHNLRAHIAEHVFHNTDWFAIPARIRDRSEVERQVQITARYRVREERDDRGTATTVETLQVGLLRSECPEQPGIGWRLYRLGESPDRHAFLFDHEGESTSNRWKATFKRVTPSGRASR